MTVVLPYKPERAAKKPPTLKGVPNGKVPAELLVRCGIRRFVMVQPAAEAMNALVAAAKKDGVRISATGTYRPYAAQVGLFLRRYDNTPRNTRHEVWNGKDWWLKPRVAGAAVPGTSNHGWGLAVDFARVNSAGAIVALDTRTLTWLAQHGPKYGYWNTVKSENWHWTYCGL